MKFINDKEQIKLRLIDKNENSGYRWINIYSGQEIELDEIVGINAGLRIADDETEETPEDELEEVEETEETTEEVKEIEENFAEELQQIKGIGRKTAEDIANVFENKISLINEIKEKNELPFREDINKLLFKEFGGAND